MPNLFISRIAFGRSSPSFPSTQVPCDLVHHLKTRDWDLKTTRWEYCERLNDLFNASRQFGDWARNWRPGRSMFKLPWFGLSTIEKKIICLPNNSLLRRNYSSYSPQTLSKARMPLLATSSVLVGTASSQRVVCDLRRDGSICEVQYNIIFQFLEVISKPLILGIPIGDITSRIFCYFARRRWPFSAMIIYSRFISTLRRNDDLIADNHDEYL